MGFLPSKVTLYTLLPLVLGNFANIGCQVLWAYDGRLRDYLRDISNLLDVAVNTLMLGFLLNQLWVVHSEAGHRAMENSRLEELGLHIELVVPAAFGRKYQLGWACLPLMYFIAALSIAFLTSNGATFWVRLAGCHTRTVICPHCH